MPKSPWTLSASGLAIPATTQPLGAGGASDPALVTTQSVSTYTLVAADFSSASGYRSVLKMGASSACSVVIPAHATLALPVGCEIVVVQMGSGQVFFSGATGVSICAPDSLYSKSQYCAITATQVAQDVWLIGGATGKYAGADPDFSNVVSLLHFDGADGSTSFLDVTGRSWAGGGILTAANPKFGPSSGSFAYNTVCPIYTPDAAALRFGTADFSVEFWALPSAPPAGFGCVFVKGVNSSGGISIGLTPTALTFRCNGTTDYTVALTLSGWSFFQISRASGVLKLNVNGTTLLSQTVSFNHNSTDTLYFGSNANSGGDARYSYCGLLDELRITTGIARDNVVPTSAFQNQ